MLLLYRIAANNVFRKNVDLSRQPSVVASLCISMVAAALLILLLGPGTSNFNLIRMSGVVFGFGILVVVFPMAAAEIMFKQNELDGQIDLMRLSLPHDQALLAGYVWASLHRGRVLFALLGSWTLLLIISQMVVAPSLIGQLAIVGWNVVWYMGVVVWSGVLAHMRAYFLKWEYDRQRGEVVSRLTILRFILSRIAATLVLFAPLLVAPVFLHTLLQFGFTAGWLVALLLNGLMLLGAISLFWRSVEGPQ